MSESKPPAPEPREIAGRYRIIRKLGAGAFGTVYRAKDTTLGRELAIKTIRLEGLAAASVDLEELLKRFKQEATAGAKLKHPNIVTIYDYGESQGQAYLAMEYVEGVGLDRLIREAGKLPEERAASIAAHVADALGYAHERGVVHRDIKPANIMIEPGERVKVTDFGVARLTDSAENLTATGGVIGTPSYMSPEQARGRKVDGRSDLFSVGCVLYELLAGCKAFTGDNITGIIFKIITEDPPPLREQAPFVSDEMLRVIRKSLAKEPGDRYQTGQEFAADLFALTQPGHVPTLRQRDVPTAHGAPPGDVPTIASPPTARGTLSSKPTVARPATPAPGGGAPETGAPPPVAPTQLLGNAGTAVPPPVPPVAAPRRPTPASPYRSARAPRKGGVGTVIAIGAGAALLLLLGVVGAWLWLGRGSTVVPPEAEPEATQVAVGTPEAVEPTPSPTVPAVSEAPTPAPGGSVPASGPAGGGASGSRAPETQRAAAPAPPPRTDPAPQGGGRASSGGGAAQRGGQETAAPAAASSATLPPPANDDAFLDELPAPQAADGRAAGRALADAYGSGNAPAYGSQARFNRRPRIPRDTHPAEQPAVRALAWILSAEKAHFQRTGRYGTLSELVDSGDLPLTGERTGDSFDRREYRVTVSTTGEGFRADARPLSPQGRPFYVDENGFVLHAD